MGAIGLGSRQFLVRRLIGKKMKHEGQKPRDGRFFVFSYQMIFLPIPLEQDSTPQFYCTTGLYLPLIAVPIYVENGAEKFFCAQLA